MNTKRKSFNISLEWYEKLKGLPAEVRVEVYDAIMEYAESGTLLDLKPMAKIAFSFIKPDMDMEIERMNAISIKRAEAGRKAMEKRYGASDNKGQQDITNLTSASKCYQMVASDNNSNQELEKNQPINNINYNITNIQERKESISKDIPKKREKSAAKAAPNDIEKRRNSFYETLKPFLAKYPPEMLRKFYDYWSEMNKSGTKMRFELERTWEVSKRLATWSSRDNSFGKSSMEIGTVLHNNTIDKYQNEDKWNR